MFNKNSILLSICLSLLLSPAIKAEEEHWYNYDHLYLQGGTYFHFNDDDDYEGTSALVSLEAVKANDWLYGLSLFDNSFGEFSQYLYGGKSWNYHGKWEGFHTKLTAGLIHGYTDTFKDGNPLGGLDIVPAIVPGVGYKKGKFGGDIILLGTSALLFTVGMDL